MLHIVKSFSEILRQTFMYSVSSSSDFWISQAENLVLMAVRTPPLGRFLRSCLKISYPLSENLHSLVRCVSCRQHTSISCSFKNFCSSLFFSLTPSAFHCIIFSLCPVEFLWSSLVTPEDSEFVVPVVLGGPLRGRGPGVDLTWPRPIRTTPYRSRVCCIASIVIRRCTFSIPVPHGSTSSDFDG